MNQITQTTVKKYNTSKTHNIKEIGQTNPVTKDPGKNWTVKNQDTKTTDVASAVHQTSQDCTTAQRNPQNVETVKEVDITKKCAAQ